MTINAHPLSWPTGWKRTDPAQRLSSRFRKTSRRDRGGNGGTRYIPQRDLTINEAVARVLAELGRMGLGRDDVVISTNLRLRLDGLPRSAQREPDDPGVACYWQASDGGHKVMAIDIYDRVADNLAAIAATLKAMRAIERHGGAAILERAFTGFVALPAPAAADSWRSVLGVPPGLRPAAEDLTLAYRRARSPAHAAGSEALTRVERAFEAAKEELGL